jgi:hypothetical protein
MEMVCHSHNLVTDPCLKIFGGKSIGLGVGRTIISELVNEVFANKTVWKSLGGTGSYVISTSPPGIQPAVESLLRLKIFGYVCRLYVVSQRALPPPSRSSLHMLFSLTMATLMSYAMHLWRVCMRLCKWGSSTCGLRLSPNLRSDKMKIISKSFASNTLTSWYGWGAYFLIYARLPFAA